MKNALESPQYMIGKLEENREKIGETAYRKALTAAKALAGLFCVSEKMLSTISYLFDKPLFEEDCMAWVHGSVYKPVYDMFKNFKYNPIEDNRFLILKNRFQELRKDAREGYLPTEPSYVVISKNAIKEYFEGVSKKYDITSADGIKMYIDEQLKLFLL